MTTDRSLQDVEGEEWGPAPAGATTVISRVHEARTLPLRDLEVEDLRLLVGQRVGLDVIVPLAAAVVADDPWAEGDFYPGDLLAALLRLDDWNARAVEREHVLAAVRRLDPDDEDHPVDPELIDAARAFATRWS